MDFSGYRSVDLQNFLAITNHCEQSGMTEIRDVKKMLQQQIHSRFNRIQRISEKNVHQQISTMSDVCPHCGVPVIKMDVDGLAIIVCKKCRWSKNGTQIL